MFLKQIILSMLALLGIVCQVEAKDYQLVSPDGKMTVNVAVEETVKWSLNHGEDALILDSPVSMTLSDGAVYGASDKVSKVTRRSVDQLLQTHIYKKSHVRDAFNEMTLK